MSYPCMDGWMHRPTHPLQKLLHWFWSWTSVLSHTVARCLGLFKCFPECPSLRRQLASGGGVCPFVPRFHRDSVKALFALSLLCRVRVHWLRLNPSLWGSCGITIDQASGTGAGPPGHGAWLSGQWWWPSRDPVPGMEFAIGNKLTEEKLCVEQELGWFYPFISEQGGGLEGKLFNTDLRLPFSCSLRQL